MLDLELDCIKSVFLEGGYPFEVTQLTIRAAKVIQFAMRVVQLKQQKETLFAAEKCSVYLKLPCIGSASKWFRTAVQRVVNNGYHNARAVVIFQAKKYLQNLSKYVIPMLATINVIYKFVCCCDNSFIG